MRRSIRCWKNKTVFVFSFVVLFKTHKFERSCQTEMQRQITNLRLSGQAEEVNEVFVWSVGSR